MFSTGIEKKQFLLWELSVIEKQRAESLQVYETN